MTAAVWFLFATSAAAEPDALTLGLKLKVAGKLEAAEVVFKRALNEDPNDLAALEQLATVLGWQKKYAVSIAIWKRAVRLAPGNSSYHLGLARVLYWRGDHVAALRQLEPHLFPEGDAEAPALRGDVFAALGRHHEARAAYRRALELSPRDAALARKLRRARGAPRARLDLGYVSERYSRLRGIEGGAYAQLGWAFTRGLNAWLRHDDQRQFGERDRTYLLGAAWRATSFLLLSGDYSFTPANRIRPRSQFNAAAELLLPRLSPLLAVRRLDYAQGAIDTYTPGVRLQLLPWFDHEYRYGITRNLDGTRTFAHQARMNFHGETFAPYLGFARGKETIPPQAAAVSTYYSAGAVCNVSRTFGFRLDYAYEERKRFYIHHSIGGGLTLRFLEAPW